LKALKTARAREFESAKEVVYLITHLFNRFKLRYLRLWNAVVKRITLVKFGVDDGGGSGTGCFGIAVRANVAKLTNVLIAVCEDR